MITIIHQLKRNHFDWIAENDKVKVTIIEGRELAVRVNDYDEPAANRGHDPPSVRKGSGGGGRNTGRRG